ncbi:MAG: sulfatase [Myxococcales bacterium]|nr:sulfatase [Myxococcales bacterium]
MSEPSTATPAPGAPDARAPQPPLAQVVIAGAATGGLAAVAAGLCDALWSWRALAQFTPGVLERLRVALYVAASYAVVGLVAGAVIAAIVAYYDRATALGTLVRHAAREHARARARGADQAVIGVSLVLAFVPIATVTVWITFARLIHVLQTRKNFALVVAVAMVASVVALAIAIALAIAVARPIEYGLRALARGRLGPALAWVWAPAVALAALVALGGVAALISTWSVVKLLPLRPPAVIAVALVFAIPLRGRGAAVAVRWRAARPWRRRALVAAVPIATFLAAAATGNRAAIIKSAVAYSGGGDPLTRLWKRMIDRDRDHHSPWFGGDDCDDGDASIHPGASDIPDDGVDQNCVAGDAKSQRDVAEVGFAPAPPTVPADVNVVLITIDTLRADHVSAYGYGRPTTPTIDAIAAEGTLFRAAWAHAPSTRYSMPAILTGRLPLDVYYDTSIAGWPGLQAKATTIAEILRGRGFATGAFTNYWYFDRVRRMDQGFDVYDNDNARLHQGADPAHTRGSSSREQTDKALGFVAANAGRRFFLWVHYYDPHHEYEPHPEVPKFGDSEIDRYDGEIRFTDLHLGRLVADLKARGLWDKTVIVITGDHGEGFGEHGVFQHGYHLYAAQTKVPLVVRVPGLPPRVSTTAVGHIDVLPTLANLAGAAPTPEMMGRSLVPLVAGGPEDPDRVVFQQLSYEGNHELRGAATLACHVLYNVSPHTSWEVYRLDDDPTETHDRADAPGPCARVRTAFERWYDSAQIPAGAGDALLPARPTIARPLDVDFGDQVRLLGLDAPAEVRPGQSVELTFSFEARGRLTGGWKVFVHVEGPAGGRFTADHAPVRPFDWWRRGQFIRYTITTTVPASAPAGAYDVWMGVWRKADRQPVVAPPGITVVERRAKVATLQVVR